jgi:outer membrane receptor protein involved in Fe transport
LCSLHVSAQTSVSGTVKDQNGHAIAGATVVARGAAGRGSIAVTSDRQGDFRFRTLSAGEYKFRVIAQGFAVAERDVLVPAADQPLNFTLEVGEAHATVTAEVGQLEETKNVAQPVSVIGANDISERATSVLAQAGEEEAGLNLQRTSPTVGAIVVRGMTGKNVVNFVDGVRFTHAGQRGGINTFFNLNEANNFQAIEVLRGPNGAQYGSDSLAGTVNLISKSPVFGMDKSEFHGEFNPSFTSADT